MSTWGFILFLLGLLIYRFGKRAPFWLWVSGVGMGLLIASFWIMSILSNIF